MRYLVIVLDGAADFPLEELGNKTPLQASKKPNLDSIAANSKFGLLKTFPDNMPTGSTTANLSILGYDPVECFGGKAIEGRGFFEAVSLGVKLGKGDVAFRCNLINVKGGLLNSHSSGNISSEEAGKLIKFLNQKLGNGHVSFYPGLSYRHVLVVKNASQDIECAQPHDHANEPLEGLLVKPLSEKGRQTADLLNKLIFDSMKLLPKHPVNLQREKEGNLPANSIWPWSASKRPNMVLFRKKFGLSGAAISAVDLVQGLAKTAGLQVIKVKGATGFWDTNYEGKAKAALQALQNNDFVFLHIEAADEASHEGNLELKLKVIEDIDKRLIRPILAGLNTVKDGVAIAVLPDHFTPVKQRSHVRGPVPFMICRPGEKPDGIKSFDEEQAKKGSFGLLNGAQFINEFLKPELGKKRRLKQSFLI